MTEVIYKNLLLCFGYIGEFVQDYLEICSCRFYSIFIILFLLI